MGKHESAPEDVKAKFREALDRKKSHGGRESGAGADGHGKADHAHGPETQRMFRRKSG
jgi:hypothetical protein